MTDGLQAETYYVEAYVIPGDGAVCQAYPLLACNFSGLVPGMTPLKLASHDISGVDFAFNDRAFKTTFE